MRTLPADALIYQLSGMHDADNPENCGVHGARTKKMGFKNLKYGDGRWFFVRAIMDEHLHKLLDRSYHVKEFKKTEFVGEASAADCRCCTHFTRIIRLLSCFVLQGVSDLLCLGVPLCAR